MHKGTRKDPEGGDAADEGNAALPPTAPPAARHEEASLVGAYHTLHMHSRIWRLLKFDDGQFALHARTLSTHASRTYVRTTHAHARTRTHTHAHARV